MTSIIEDDRCTLVAALRLVQALAACETNDALDLAYFKGAAKAIISNYERNQNDQ